MFDSGQQEVFSKLVTSVDNRDRRKIISRRLPISEYEKRYKEATVSPITVIRTEVYPPFRKVRCNWLVTPPGTARNRRLGEASRGPAQYSRLVTKLDFPFVDALHCPASLGGTARELWYAKNCVVRRDCLSPASGRRPYGHRASGRNQCRFVYDTVEGRTMRSARDDRFTLPYKTNTRQGRLVESSRSDLWQQAGLHLAPGLSWQTVFRHGETLDSSKELFRFSSRHCAWGLLHRRFRLGCSSTHCCKHCGNYFER